MMVAGAAVRNKNLTAGILSVSNVKEKWWQKKSQRSTHTVQKQSEFSVVRRQFVRCSHSFIHFGDKPIRRSGSTILANISQWDFLYSFSLLSMCPFFFNLIYSPFWLSKWRIFCCFLCRLIFFLHHLLLLLLYLFLSMRSDLLFSSIGRWPVVGMMLCCHFVYECHCKFQEHAAHFYSNDNDTKGFWWQHTLLPRGKETTSWPIQFRFVCVWFMLFILAQKLVNNWTDLFAHGISIELLNWFRCKIAWFDLCVPFHSMNVSVDFFSLSLSCALIDTRFLNLCTTLSARSQTHNVIK